MLHKFSEESNVALHVGKENQRWVKQRKFVWGTGSTYCSPHFHFHFHFRWNIAKDSNIETTPSYACRYKVNTITLFFFIGRWDRHVSVVHYNLPSFCSPTIILFLTCFHSFNIIITIIILFLFAQSHITPKYQTQHLFLTYITNDEMNILIMFYLFSF